MYSYQRNMSRTFRKIIFISLSSPTPAFNTERDEPQYPTPTSQ
jgi:hypothetical protein